MLFIMKGYNWAQFDSTLSSVLHHWLTGLGMMVAFCIVYMITRRMVYLLQATLLGRTAACCKVYRVETLN